MLKPLILFFLRSDEPSVAGPLAILASMWLFILAVLLLFWIGLWKVFAKAGKPGWAAIIPIYREIMFTEIVGRPTWWAFIYIIPCTAFIAHIILSIDLARSFGKPTGFSVGLILFPFIFYPILGFGSAQYVGPSATDKN